MTHSRQCVLISKAMHGNMATRRHGIHRRKRKSPFVRPPSPITRQSRNSRSAKVVTKLLESGGGGGRKDSLYVDLVEDDGLRVSHGRDGFDEDDDDDLEDFPDVGRLLPPVAPASV